jgi:hypothetical protein
MRLTLVAVVFVAWAGSAQAACEVESGAYHAEKSLPKADAYISCFETATATPTFAPLSPTGPVVIATPTPTFGPITPGNPNGMPIDEFLRQVKEQGGYSDYDWTQIMASSISADGSMAVVYDKNALAPQYANEAPFEITAASPKFKLKQYFVDPGKFTELSQYALEGGQ